MKHRAIASVLVLAIGSSGCSFTLPVPPSDPSKRTREAAKECSARKDRWFYPVADSIAAVVGAYNVGVAAGAEPDDDVRYVGLKVDRSVGFWALGVVPLVLFGAGAVYGYVQCVRCDTLQREHRIGTAKPAPAETPEQREDRWTNPGDGTSKAFVVKQQGDGRTGLPEWSAFEREPLEPLPEEEPEGPAKPAPKEWSW